MASRRTVIARHSPRPSPPTLVSLAAALDRLHARARANPWLYRFAIANRILLFAAFLPTGLVKLSGHRFTSLSPDGPVGYFFEAMYRTGLYWRFLGAAQIAAALCLIVPGAATLGAVLFFPIALNIFIITVSLPFAGTPVITAGMLLAAFYLLCWDYDRLKGVLWHEPYGGGIAAEAATRLSLSPLERLAAGLGGAGLFGVMMLVRGIAPRALGRPLLYGSLALLAAGVLLALVSIPDTYRRLRAARVAIAGTT